jgi:hypothetical protein
MGKIPPSTKASTSPADAAATDSVALFLFLLPLRNGFQSRLFARVRGILLAVILTFRDDVTGGLHLATVLSVGGHDHVVFGPDGPFLNGPRRSLLVQRRHRHDVWHVHRP